MLSDSFFGSVNMYGMVRAGLVLILVLSCISCTPSLIRSDLLNAQVFMKEGMPCFTVANSRKNRKAPPDISGIFVFDDRKEHPLWTWDASASRTLFPTDCILYGEDSPAPSLEQGVIYRVRIFEISQKGEWNRSGNAYFCLPEEREEVIVFDIFSHPEACFLPSAQ